MRQEGSVFSLFLSSNGVREVLFFPPLTIDVNAGRAMIHERVLPLTKREFEILLLLARTPETTCSPGKLYAEIWHMPDLGDIRTVRVHISRLRKKLRTACPQQAFIKMIWNQGYQFTMRKSQIYV